MSDLSEDMDGLDEPDWENSDQDYLSGETDTDPTYLGSVQFLPDSPGAVEGHIYTDAGSELPSDIRQLDLVPLAELLGLEGFSQGEPEVFFDPIPEDFDYDDPNVRGPFFDLESVDNWLQDTGMAANVSVYYDEDNDEYWLDIEGTP